jgi:alkylation response protein AidB-like acyl-CoA dehydrogenase
MDPYFTRSHEQLRQEVRALAEQEIAPVARELDEHSRFPWDNVRKIADRGWFGANVPQQYGGLGLDTISYILIIEELARVDASHAITLSAHSTLAMSPILSFGTEAQKQRYLPLLAKGRVLGGFGLTEPGAGSDAGATRTVAVRHNGGYRLTGSKIFITNGVHGDLYFVAARTGDPTPGRRHDGLSMFLVERGWPGFEVSRTLDKMGMRASDTAELTFQDCPVPAENLLGAEGRGFQQLAAGLQRERLLAAVLARSGAEQALEDTVAYLRQREAFGEPLAARQALRHRVADMATELEAARRLLYHAAGLYAAGAECAAEVSMAKLFATEVANRVAYQAVQLHGGYGYMREFPVEGFFRDVRLWTIASGTSEVMREIVARKLL